MAIVDEKDARVELKAIDINDMSLKDGARENINPDADAWASPAPQPDGVYLVQLFPGRKPFEQGETDDDEKKLFIRANIDCKVQDDKDWKDTLIFANVSTLIGAGREISTMAGLIRKFGPVKIPTAVTPLETARLLARCLKQEPKLYVEGEWKAWDDKNKQWFLQGMKNFPKIEGTNKHNHLVRDNKGNLMTGRFKVVKWYGLKEYKAMMEAQQQRKQGLNAPPNGVGQQRAPEVVSEFTEIGAPVSGRAADNVRGAAPQEDDFILDQ